MEKTITDTPELQYLWVNSSYWLNNQAIWRTWPAREMSGPFKWYHLVQLAFSFQQILVIHLEKRRKDHNQMLTHHIITCITISVAYVYRYTNVANVVLCLMDIVDLLLPVSPCQSLQI
jgi:very-long-chain ceramide synthase